MPGRETAHVRQGGGGSRLQCFYGEDTPLPHPLLTAARQALDAHYRPELGEPFCTAGLCLYRDGRDSVAWHGDTIGRGQREDTMVAIVSLGTARPLLPRPRARQRGGGDSLRFEVGHGDLLVMGGSCQRTWEHAVPKTSQPVGLRIAARGTLAGLGLRPGQYGLVTLHRPANVDDLAVLGALLPALAEISRTCPLVLPAHPRVNGLLDGAGLPASVRIIPPLGYLDFIALEASARLVLTDSGGVQEETTMLRVPCLTLRDSSERSITLTEGTNQLVGRDPGRIARAAHEVTAAPPRPPRRPALWDGQAGQRIAAALVAGHELLRKSADQADIVRLSTKHLP